LRIRDARKSDEKGEEADDGWIFHNIEIS
jgi:hypothetical protein